LRTKNSEKQQKWQEMRAFSRKKPYFVHIIIDKHSILTYPSGMPKSPSSRPNSTTEEQAVRVSVSEAARLFGVNPRTIRRAISSGELRYVVVRGRYKLHFGSLVSWSQRTITARNKRDTHGIGQWVEQWKIKNPKYSPRTPQQDA
jgi:excisionase family DNA binding protein